VERITKKVDELYTKLKNYGDKSTSDLFRVAEIVEKWGSDKKFEPELKHMN
jgi:hypothetical protein